MELENLFQDSNSENEEDLEETCIICEEYERSEQWHWCVRSGKWAHKVCTGAASPVLYVWFLCMRLNTE